jgi:hypothetical protein
MAATAATTAAAVAAADKEWGWCATYQGHFTDASALVGGHHICNVCRETSKRRCKRRRRQMRETLQAMHRPCAECGERRLLWLEFAHFDRNSKRYQMTVKPSVRKLAAEIDRVRSLCVVCHMAETIKENKERGIGQLSGHDAVFDLFLKQYGGKCQCGQLECDVQAMDASTPLHFRRLIEWDHQPQFNKTASIATLKQQDARRKRGPFMSSKLFAELKKCLPLFRPHHRIITDYRRKVDPMYKAGDPLPQAWRAMFVAPSSVQ